MKTQTKQLNFFQLCVNYLQSLSSHWPLSARTLTPPQSTIAFQIKDLPARLARLVQTVGRRGVIKAQILAFGLNSRIFFGVGFIAVLAPASMASYLLFEKSLTSDWYYQNMYWFMWTLAPHLNLLITVLGIFLLFPINSKRSWFLLAPVGQTIAKIIHFASVQSNEQYHQVIGLQVYVLSFLTAIALMISLNWLTHRKFHEFDSLISKIVGLSSILPDSKEKQMLRKTASELQNWNKKF